LIQKDLGGDKKMEWEVEELYKLGKIQPDIYDSNKHIDKDG
jgi:hypothetical protein